MPNTLSQKEIGKRIMKLRKAKGLSQDELAKELTIPRSSLAQIELGNRSVNVRELLRLSHLLTFSLDEFLGNEFTISKEEPFDKQPFDKQLFDKLRAKEKQQERISVPSLSVSKFKNILLYILERCAGKPNVGETVLYKLLYFSDFNYYELYEEHLSGARYRKLPYGPVPLSFEKIVNSMIEKGEIKKIKTEYFKKLQTRYLPLQKADLTKLMASEKEVIDRVIEQMSDWSASSVSDYSHNDMPWKASKEGEIIDYELAFYRTPPFSVRNYGNEIEKP